MESELTVIEAENQRDVVLTLTAPKKPKNIESVSSVRTDFFLIIVNCVEFEKEKDKQFIKNFMIFAASNAKQDKSKKIDISELEPEKRSPSGILQEIENWKSNEGKDYQSCFLFFIVDNKTFKSKEEARELRMKIRNLFKFTIVSVFFETRNNTDENEEEMIVNHFSDDVRFDSMEYGLDAWFIVKFSEFSLTSDYATNFVLFEKRPKSALDKVLLKTEKLNFGSLEFFDLNEYSKITKKNLNIQEIYLKYTLSETMETVEVKPHISILKPGD